VVDQRDRPIRRVHRADQAHVAGDAQGLSAGKRDLTVPVLQQVHQLTEHPRKVGAVDLVDDQHTPILAAAGPVTELEKSARPHRVVEPAVFPCLRT